MKRLAVFLALAANHRHSEIAVFLNIASSFVFKIIKEMEASGKDVFSLVQILKINKILYTPTLFWISFPSTNFNASVTRTPEYHWRPFPISLICRSQQSDVRCMGASASNPVLWGKGRSCPIVLRANLAMRLNLFAKQSEVLSMYTFFNKLWRI